MAERISGLSISLDLETAQVDRSLSQIKNSFSSLRKSAQVNMNNIRFGSKDITTYKKNVDELTKSYDAQKQNVDDIKKRMDLMSNSLSDTADKMNNLKKAGKENTEEFAELNEQYNKQNESVKKINGEYNRQVDELNKLSHALDGTQEGLRDLYVEQSKFTKMGSVFSNAGSGIQTFGSHVKDVGGGLTRWITTPILGATTAAVGLTSALGWKRLVGIDNARAQLKGMGYDTEAVGRITDQVSEAVQGGMMTVAEGTSAAAGAMAAGVKEGDELNKYLKLIDAGAVGMNRSVSETAMIFNRVQGSGKLMTQELNMIEESMPGFSSQLAEHLGVAPEAMREMVTAGEVTSDDFLNVMEGMAGGMAEAYSDTWSGMIQNTLANIGILGQNLLGGVFEQSKESIREFLGLLRSEQIRNWAAEAGEMLGQVFTNIVDKVRTGVEWFTNLSTEQKKMIGIFGAVAVAAGPLLTVFGGITIFIGKTIGAIAPLFTTLGKLSGSFKAVRSGVMTFGKAFPKLASFLGIITGPVGITIGVITALGTAFTIAYAKSETFRNIIGSLKDRFVEAWQSAMTFKDNLTTAITAVISMFKGDWTGGISLLQKLGLSPDQILAVENGVLAIRYKFHQLKQALSAAFSAIASFAQQTFQKIYTFWQSDGQQVIQAITNGVNLVRSIVGAVMPVITTIIGTAFKLALAVVKMVWENIKGVINGALNVIMGLVRVFTGLFTGDFSKMWEGVKQIFAGAIQVVWNGFQLLFYGRIIKGVGSLVRLFSGSIRSLWTNVVNFFKGMFTGATTQATNLFNRVISIGRSLNTGFNNIVRSMVQGVLNWFRNMRTNITTTVGNIRSGVQNTFSALRDFAVNSAVRLKDGVVNGYNTMKDRATALVLDLKDKALGYFDDMVEGAKALPGKFGQAIKNGASKAVDGIKSLGNSMVSKLGNVVNGVIEGLNSITGKIGISATIDKWNVPRFSTGTGSPSGKLTKNGKIAADTITKVGDKGPGNGKGTRELVHYPNGKVGLYDNDATIFAPKGTTIFSNKETEAMLDQIPRFSTGTGLWGRIKEIAGKAVDYITNPKKIFDDLISAVGNKFGDLSGFAGNLIKGVWDKIKDGMLSWITDRFGEATVGKSQKWMNYRMTTPYSPNAPVPGYPTSFNGGRHYGIDYGTPTGVPITAPIAGTVTRMSDVGGGLVARLQLADKAVQYFMHMSSVKTGKVGVGESVGKSGNSGKWTTGPHVHWQHEDPSASYIQNRNTKNPLSTIKGHLKGGQILSDGLFNLHKGEYVINPNEPTEAMKLLAIVGKKLAGKSKQTSELPNVATGNNNNEVVDKLTEMIGNQQQQIEQMNEAIKVLLGIEDKTGFDPNKAQKSMNKFNNRRTIMT